MQSHRFCFATLAMGKKYRSLALELAKDLEKFTDIKFILLTDKPLEFSQQTNVLAFLHTQQSVSCYHDKCYVLEKALSLYDACIFLDADMRILREIVLQEWLPGITARSYANIIKHNQNNTFLPDLQKIAKKWDLDLENINFVSEFLFVITKDNHKEQEFIKLWKKLGNYLELHGIYNGEGNAIALAAAKAGLIIRYDEMPGIDFFNDKIEKIRIQKGQRDANITQKYFDEYQKIAFPNKPKWQKALDKLGYIIKRFYLIIRLKIKSLADINFYYK